VRVLLLVTDSSDEGVVEVEVEVEVDVEVEVEVASLISSFPAASSSADGAAGCSGVRENVRRCSWLHKWCTGS
jgi:hypothetical protein